MKSQSNSSVFILFLVFLGLTLSCRERKDLDAVQPIATPDVDTSYWRVNVNNLRMRSAPNLESATLTLLPQGAIVKSWGERSIRQDEITLRGKAIRDYWYQAKYDGQMGWIFAGALSAVDDDPTGSTLIIPGKSFGPVFADDREVDIINRLGKDQVDRKSISIGEGETVEGTVVFGNSDKELIILWREQDFTHIHEVRSVRPDAPWKTESGIGMGTSLKQVEKANEGPFRLTGFQWDFAGMTVGWNQGKIEKDLVLIFQQPERIHQELIGDQIFTSDNARMRRANPLVGTIRLLFP